MVQNSDDLSISVKTVIRQKKSGDMLIELKASKENGEHIGTALVAAPWDEGDV